MKDQKKLKNGFFENVWCIYCIKIFLYQIFFSLIFHFHIPQEFLTGKLFQTFMDARYIISFYVYIGNHIHLKKLTMKLLLYVNAQT